jgi:hypothetical protein
VKELIAVAVGATIMMNALVAGYVNMEFSETLFIRSCLVDLNFQIFFSKRIFPFFIL